MPDGAHTVAARAVDTATNQTTSDCSQPHRLERRYDGADLDDRLQRGRLRRYLQRRRHCHAERERQPRRLRRGRDLSTRPTAPIRRARTDRLHGRVSSSRATTTVKYRAFDIAGNAEAVNSQLITIDTAPATRRRRPRRSPATGPPAPAPTALPVSVTLSASDDPGGSGVCRDPLHHRRQRLRRRRHGTVYSGAFTVSATTTVKYRAVDNAGNTEAVNSQLITIGTALRR